MIKRIFSVAVLLILCFCLTACAAHEQDPSSAQAESEDPMLTVWTFFERNTPGYYYLFLWEDLAKELDLELEVKNYSVQEMEDKLSLALVTGELPDIFLTEDGTWLENFTAAGACAALDSEIRELSYREEYEPAMQNGNMFLFPCMLHDYAVVYYDTTLFSKMGIDIPESFADLEKMITKVKQYNARYKTDISVISFGGKDGYEGNLLMNMLIAAQQNAKKKENIASAPGDGIKDPEQAADVKVDDAVRSAAEKMVRLTELDAFEEGYMETGDEEAITNFIHHKSLMLIGHSSAISHLIWNMGEGFSVGLLPGSYRKDGSYPIVRLNVETPVGLCVNSECMYRKDAVRLCQEYIRRIDRENVAAGYHGMLSGTDVEAKMSSRQLAQLDALVGRAEEVAAPDEALTPEERNAKVALIKDLYGLKSEAGEFTQKYGKIIQ